MVMRKKMTLKNVPFSFEFLPFHEDNSLQNILNQNPKFVSLVNFSAYKLSVQKDYLDSLENNALLICPHVTCVSAPKTQLVEMVKEYKEIGIERLMALHGDVPINYKKRDAYFEQSCDLIHAIRSVSDFEIYVGAYPEKHPMSKSMDEDLDFLKKKLDMGANAVITQFFFDHEVFLRFRDHVRDAGIQIPIIPGIIACTDSQKLKKMSEICHVPFNPYFREILEREEAAQWIEHHIIKMCKSLVDSDIEGIHFFTMNDSAFSVKLVHDLELK
jgi:methylenetetrahydrofolate reductase (NADPH)